MKKELYYLLTTINQERMIELLVDNKKELSIG
jgi:hypothetical protein